MPNRFIREGLISSERVACLNAQDERLYIHLLLCADDAGRIDARTHYLKTRLFPVSEQITTKSIEVGLDTLLKVELIRRYNLNGKEYIQITNWMKCSKSERSYCPDENGVYEITFEERETREGRKKFVTSSLIDNHNVGAIDIIKPDVRENRTTTAKSSAVQKPGPADEIVDLYLSKTGKGADDSKQRGIKNVQALLNKKVDRADLERAIDNYAALLKRKPPESSDYIKKVGNFFGKDETWKSYLREPVEAQKPLSSLEQALNEGKTELPI